MKTLFRSMGFMVILLILFLSLPLIGIAADQEAFFLASPIPIACYMALTTVSAKKMWQKLWLNSLFWVSNIATALLAYNYVFPKYMPQAYESLKNHPDLAVQVGVNCVIIYLTSVIFFIFVYHVGRQAQAQENVNAQGQNKE